VEANNGPARNGTLTVAGKTYTVTQNNGCAYSINPTSRSHTAAAGTGTVGVTTAAGCAWTAASNATTWLTVTAGASGNGGGTVTYSFTGNTTASQRTGTLTIAGQAFSVTQTDPSVLSIDSVTPRVGKDSGGQQVTLNGFFANVSGVSVGGVTATVNSSSATQITITTPAHAAGAVGIGLVTTSGSTYTKPNAFAYLPTAFTDDPLVAGVTQAKAQHVIELRQAVDALRAVAGLAPAQWRDPSLTPNSIFIKAAHVADLRTFLEEAAAGLGFAPQAYTDPDLGAGSHIKRIHIEELRQRVRLIAG
jgi:hypothetical protein